MQDGCVWAKKDRVRLRVCWRTAASKHGRSYAIMCTLPRTDQPRKGCRETGCSGLFGLSRLFGLNQTNQDHPDNPNTPEVLACSLSRKFAAVGVVRSWSGP